MSGRQQGWERSSRLLRNDLNRRTLLKGAAAAGAVAGLGGTLAHPAGARQETAPSGVLQLGGESEPSGSWLPYRASGGAETQVFDLIFSRLIRFDADYNLIPDLAERFEINDDASEFTFYLRQNVTWHDGEPFDADDVIFTYRLAMEEGVGASQYNKLSQIQGAEAYRAGEAEDVAGLQRVDDYTVKIVLEQPNIAFLIGAAHNNSLVWILPEHVLVDADPAALDQHEFARNPTVGTGPFRFVEYVPDQYVATEANPDYFLGSPKLAQVFVRMAAPATQLASLESGELHVMQAISASDAERLAESAVVDIVPTPGVGIFQTAIMNERITDKRVRQAFMYGTDRASIMDVVLRGQGRLVNQTVIGPEWAQYDDLNTYPYDPDQARALLEEASWDSSQSLVLIWEQGFQAIELAAPVFQQQMAEIGVDVTLTPLDEAAFEKRVLEDMDFDLAWFGGGAYGLDPDVSSTYYACENWTPNGGNTTHYCNEELDALFEQGRATSDTDERREIYHQAAQILNEDVPTIFWWSENMIWGINKRVEGVVPGPNTDIHWNIHEWSLAE
ncbi:MAG TPA: ABC transporter substrate-binding protein [Thermomicrobiales bacterium]|nr:ABC transporter substrate-binding protein [Thermomicrobiales bacterium]